MSRTIKVSGVALLVIALVSVLAIAVAIYLPATIFQRVLFAWVAIGSALGPVIVCRALGLRIQPQRLLPAIAGGFLAAVLCYLLPNTPGDLLERAGPFTLGLLILLPRRG